MHVGEGDFFYRPESSPDNDRRKLFISSWRMYGKLPGQVKLLLKYYWVLFLVIQILFYIFHNK